MTSSDSHKEDKTVTHADIVEVRHADDVRLAELGYKSEFKREFSVSCLFAVGATQFMASTALRNGRVLVLYNGCNRFCFFYFGIWARQWCVRTAGYLSGVLMPQAAMWVWCSDGLSLPFL